VSAPVIQANYDDLATIANNFSQQAQAVQHLIQQMTQLERALESGGWTGLGAEAFFAEMGDLVFPAMHRLNGALSDAHEVVGRISTVFQDAEEEASRQFQGDHSRERRGGGMILSASESDDDGAGVSVNPRKYKSGVDGWSVISMDDSQGFEIGETVYQKGPTCTLYAALNLLIASGYDISRDSADFMAKYVAMENAWWRPDMWFDDMPNLGFTLNTSEDVLDKYNAKIQRGDFNEYTPGGFFSPPKVTANRAKAEQFLINTVRNGKPVLVSMEVDDSFGNGWGGHAANVIGVQTGPDGKLTKVLVSTNWRSRPVVEIPAAAFMDDWMNADGGEYITIDRKPAPPPPPPNPGAGFSKALLEEFEKDGVMPTHPPPPSDAPRR
jgi:WXG100 family type VII secretion target